MNKLTLLILLLLSANNLLADNWQKIKKQFEKNIVVVEYYEQTESVVTIVEKSRIKKYLTGILLNKNGLVITSSDIFKANLESSSASLFFRPSQLPQEIKVKAGKKDYGPATFIGKDDDKGIAFIRLNKPTDQNIRFTKKDSLIIGENYLLINRLGKVFKNELIINERRILAKVNTPVEFYLCESTVETLSDFGLVVNKYGKAIGIYKNKEAQAGGGMFHFAMKASNSPLEITLYKTIESLIEKPPVYKEKETERKKWLGVYTQPFTRDMAKYFGIPQVKGVFINTVIKNSPADKAGIKMKDIVTKIDGEKVSAEDNNDLSNFREIIRNKKTDKAAFSIYRDSTEMTIIVNLRETPISQFLAEEVSSEFLGFGVKELTQDVILSQKLEMDIEGLWVSRVERGGWADVAGLQVGDLLLEINGQKTADIKKIKTLFDTLEKENKEYIMMFINRRGQTQYLFIDIRKEMAEGKEK